MTIRAGSDNAPAMMTRAKSRVIFDTSTRLDGGNVGFVTVARRPQHEFFFAHARPVTFQIDRIRSG
jgi:hypothetical protein